MRARYWLLLLYLLLGIGLSLWTGTWSWLAWALPIALAITTVLLVSGHTRAFTIRRRLRQMSELADRIGARDGKLVYEHRQRQGVLGYDPRLTLQTVHEGTEAKVRGNLLVAAATAGYLPNYNGHLVNDAGILLITVKTEVRNPRVFNTLHIPDGEVHVEVSIEERKDGIRPTRFARRHFLNKSRHPRGLGSPVDLDARQTQRAESGRRCRCGP